MTHLRWVMSFQNWFYSPSNPQSWTTGQNTDALHISYNICSYEQQMFIHSQAWFADWWLTFFGSWAFNRYLTVLAILSLEWQGRIPMLCISPITFTVMNDQWFIIRKSDLRTEHTFVGSWAFKIYLTFLAILSLERQGRIPMLCISPITFAVMNNKCFSKRKPDLRTDDSPSLGHELSTGIWHS
jgi:hypothetical protein